MDASVLAPRRPIGQRLFVAGLLLLFLMLGVQYSFKAFKNRSAFLRWREQILSLDSGTNIYQTYTYPNPPVMALMLRPLAALDPVPGAMLWFTLKVAMALLALAAAFRMVEAGGLPIPSWAKAITVLLSLRPIMGDLSHGNVNILILFLIVAALYAWHRGYDLLAGVVLALAICCKVTPALFVPYFMWKRQWRLLMGVGIGLALFLFEVPALFLGWNENLVQLQSWIDQMIVPFLKHGVVTSEHPNQSLPGLIHRLLTHSPSFSAYPGGVYTPTEYHNVMDLGPAMAKWLIRLAQGGFALVVLLLCRARERSGWRIAIELSMVLVAMLIFSERTWKHHCVTLVLPFATLMYVIAAVPIGRGMRRGIIAALAVAITLMLSASGLFSNRIADLTQVYGVYTFAFFAILAALILCGIKARRAYVTARVVPGSMPPSG